ncbi:patatin-like phospholipase domain-containing protein 4 [Esox lucius]|uniref:PNPLA domain-containing protein n=1 Tax=Esox lucius TaxID=8010 RepID=A0A3P8YLA2_ESOLU|nr:patatin-like phospholipase domain-containing protein 4 [Esox lucius]
MSVQAVNLSFAACGFLGIYQLGACGAILRHGDKLLGSLRACAGASAGALVAAMVVTAPEKLERVKEFTLRFAKDVRSQRLGAVTPGYDFMLTLRDGIEEFLPSNAHSIAGDRLHISITHSKSGKNSIVSHFASREDLIKVLLASSFVPVYAGIKPVEWKGKKWIDGGFTDGLPVLPEGRTVTVSPFAGHQDICPKHRGLLNLHLRLANMGVMLSKENIVRLNQSLFPPPEARMLQYCEEGHEDAMTFLKKENWIQ